MFWQGTRNASLDRAIWGGPGAITGIADGIWRFARRRRAGVPLAAGSAAAGFPSPAEGHLEQRLDFNDLIVEDEAATFVVRIRGDSMKGAGLFDGDYAVINRARTPTSGCIVLAIIDGEFVVKQYFHRGRDILLRAANPDFEDIVITEERQFEVWGVLTSSIRKF